MNQSNCDFVWGQGQSATHVGGNQGVFSFEKNKAKQENFFLSNTENILLASLFYQRALKPEFKVVLGS
jgi:hypothetical protein